MADDTGQPADSGADDNQDTPAPDGAKAPAPEGGAPEGGDGDDGDKPFFDPGDDAPAAAPADWPEDWRAKMAGEDDKMLKRLGRFKSPLDMHKAWLSADKKISSGQLREPFPEDGTDDDKSAWREANEIPAKAEDYDTKLGDGFVIGEEDKPAVDMFLTEMHGANADQGSVTAALSAYYNIQDAMAAEQMESDKDLSVETEEALRAEFGAEYRGQVNAANNFMSSAPGGLGALLAGARLSDGTPLASNVDAVKWFMDLAQQTNPLGTVVPGSGADAAKSVDGEIKELEGMMADRKSEYYKGPKSEDHQKRYRDLVAARERLSAKQK